MGSPVCLPTAEGAHGLLRLGRRLQIQQAWEPVLIILEDFLRPGDQHSATANLLVCASISAGLEIPWHGVYIPSLLPRQRARDEATATLRGFPEADAHRQPAYQPVADMEIAFRCTARRELAEQQPAESHNFPPQLLVFLRIGAGHRAGHDHHGHAAGPHRSKMGGPVNADSPAADNDHAARGQTRRQTSGVPLSAVRGAPSTHQSEGGELLPVGHVSPAEQGQRRSDDLPQPLGIRRVVRGEHPVLVHTRSAQGVRRPVQPFVQQTRQTGQPHGRQLFFPGRVYGFGPPPVLENAPGCPVSQGHRCL